MTLPESDILLRVDNLRVSFRVDKNTVFEAVKGISFDIPVNRTVALVGESGSGKSVSALAVMGLLPEGNTIIDPSSKILFEGNSLFDMTGRQRRQLCGSKISMVFQEPMSSLNPVFTVGYQIGEVLRFHKGMTGREARERTTELLDEVGIPDPSTKVDAFPHQLSGGQQQRVMIAMAIACEPRLLIADEPTTALDVTIQAQILHLLRDLQKQYGLTLIYITHDLGVVANVADRIAVMYAGDIVEIGTSDEIFFDARHPYTWALLSSLPQLGEHGKDLFAIAGTPPNLFRPVRGDAFAPRNPYALKIDFEYRPPYFEITPTHKARTWLLDPRAPHIERPACLDKIAEMGGYIHE